MNKIQLIGLLSVAVFSSACQGGGVATDTAAKPAPTPAATSIAAASTVAAKPLAVEPAKQGFDAAVVVQAGGLVKQCGAAQMALQCAASSKDCTSTSLRYVDAQGNAVEAAKPKGMDTYTAVGVGCLTAKDGSNYFVVKYGELPYGCAFCEWFHLYDSNGAVLTHSDPPILTGDAAAPDDQAPNNNEFKALHRKLGLGRPKVDSLPAGEH
jgi:hypothetical protein